MIEKTALAATLYVTYFRAYYGPIAECMEFEKLPESIKSVWFNVAEEAFSLVQTDSNPVEQVKTTPRKSAPRKTTVKPAETATVE